MMLADPRDLFTPGFDRPSSHPHLRPLGSVRVRRDHPLFGGKLPHVAALFGSHGMQSLCETAGGALSYSQVHPSNEGLRRTYARMIADRVGSNDDRLVSASAVPCVGPNGTANTQSIFLVYTPFAYSPFDEEEGKCQVGQSGFRFHPYYLNTVRVGYWAANGSVVYYSPPLKNADVNVMAMSIANGTNEILFNVNGISSATLTGTLVAIGNGVGEGDGGLRIGGAEESTLHYLHPNGYVHSVFAGNGFLTQGQLNALVADPYRELLEPDHGAVWYVPAGDQLPSGDVTAETTGVPAAGQIGNVAVTVGYVVAVAGLAASGSIGPVLASASATEAVAAVTAAAAIGSVAVPSAEETGIAGCSASGGIGSILLRIDVAVPLSPSTLMLELGAPWVRRSGWAPEPSSSEDWAAGSEADGGWADSEPVSEEWASEPAGTAGWSAIQKASGGWVQ